VAEKRLDRRVLGLSHEERNPRRSGTGGHARGNSRHDPRAVKLATNEEACPRADGGFIESVMYSNRKILKLETGNPKSAGRRRQSARAVDRPPARFALDAEGKALPKNKVYQLRDGIFEALLYHFKEDPTMAAWGEENRDWGGAFAVYRGLTEALPYPRLFNSSISEGAIVGSGVGYALSGGGPSSSSCTAIFWAGPATNIQHSLQVAGHVGGTSENAPRHPRLHRKQIRGPAQPGLVRPRGAHSGLKSVFPRDSLRRQGMMHLALSGTDPVVFPREPASVRCG
jgi:2-oxoisovalerate dehydrogenase E1 component